MKRRKPLKVDPEKVRAWQQRSRTRLKRSAIKPRAKKRSLAETIYSMQRSEFLREYPTCPITGGKATQVHHSAKREGAWLNLRRYWIGVSHEGHELIEGNKRVAETLGLMVRIRQSYSDHCADLMASSLSLTIPVFYEKWDGEPLAHHFS